MLPASTLGDYPTSASSMSSCFSSSYRPVGKPVSHHVVTRPTFSSLLFWIIIPAILPATMLGYYSMSVSLTPSEFFIVVSIYWKPASYRSSLDLPSFGKTTTGWLPSRFVFSFGPTRILFDLSIALRLRHDLSKVAAPTPRSGLVRHGYPWVPTDQAHGRP
jgi:hypothetical protein